MQLTAELRLIAQEVNAFIEASTFPSAVRPDYLAEAMRSYPANGGKRLRPALMLWSAAAAGGKSKDLLPAAAALEIFHNWTLVHDDIIDNDDVRRGQPTAHVTLSAAMPLAASQQKKFGCDMAILAGDLMQAWAFELICQSKCSDSVKLKLAAELRKYGYIKLISGEAIDVEMSYRNTPVTVQELLDMQSGKTGALFHYALRAGWMAGKGYCEAWDEEEAVALGNYGEKLALAFQMRDDVLGIFGDFEKFGKPIGSDLAEGKSTLLLLHAMANLAAEDQSRLQSLLHCDNYTPAMLNEARSLFEKAGSLQYVLNTIKELTDDAGKELEKLPPTDERELLYQLADYLATREK